MILSLQNLNKPPNQMLTNLISVSFMIFISQNHVSEVKNKNKRTIHFLDEMAIYSSKKYV